MSIYEKKIGPFFVFLQCLAHTFLHKQKLQIVSAKMLCGVGVIENNTPVIKYYTEKEERLFTIREYWVDIGTETFGPYDSINDITFSPDGKNLAFRGDYQNYVYFDNVLYKGNICGNKVVYLKDGAIWIKD